MMRHTVHAVHMQSYITFWSKTSRKYTALETSVYMEG